MRNVSEIVFGKRHSELSPKELLQFKNFSRRASYYRRHEANKARMRDQKQVKKLEVIDRSGHTAKCSKCGYDKYIGALDFHHTGDKAAGVLSLPIEQAIEEARRCIVLCANCHREAHQNDTEGTGRPQKLRNDPLFVKFYEAFTAQGERHPRHETTL